MRGAGDVRAGRPAPNWARGQARDKPTAKRPGRSAPNRSLLFSAPSGGAGWPVERSVESRYRPAPSGPPTPSRAEAPIGPASGPAMALGEPVDRKVLSPGPAGAGALARPILSSCRLVMGITGGRGPSSRWDGGASEPEQRVQELRSGALTTPQRGQIMSRQGTRQNGPSVLQPGALPGELTPRPVAR